MLSLLHWYCNKTFSTLIQLPCSTFSINLSSSIWHHLTYPWLFSGFIMSLSIRHIVEEEHCLQIISQQSSSQLSTLHFFNCFLGFSILSLQISLSGPHALKLSINQGHLPTANMIDHNPTSTYPWILWMVLRGKVTFFFFFFAFALLNVMITLTTLVHLYNLQFFFGDLHFLGQVCHHQNHS